MKRPLVITLLCAAAVVLAALAIRPGPPATKCAPDPTTTANAAPRATVASNRDVKLQSAPVNAAPAAVEATQARASARDRATLVLTARDPRGAPLPGTWLRVTSDGAVVASAKTKAEGACSLDVPFDVPLVVEATPRPGLDGRGALRVADDAPIVLAPGEWREVDVAFVSDCDGRFVARFLQWQPSFEPEPPPENPETGERLPPLAGAAIRELNRASCGERVERRVGRQLTSLDAQGRVSLCPDDVPTHAWSIELPGWSPKGLGVDPEATQATSMRFEVRPSARLTVEIVDSSPRARAALEVHLCVARSVVEEYRTKTTALEGAFTLIAPVGPDGTATFVDAPSRDGIRLHVVCGGHVVREHPDEVRLTSGAPRTVRIEIGKAPQLAVQVLDATRGSDAHAGKCELALLREGVLSQTASGEGRLDPSNVRSIVRRTLSDEIGRGFFDDLEPGTWWVAIEPFRAPWEKPFARAPVPVAKRIEVHVGDELLEVTLRTWKGLYLRGTVEVPDGRLFPANATAETTPNVLFLARALDGTGTLTGQPERDGTFAIGPVSDGEYELTTFGRGYAPIEPLRVRASDPPIVIRMQLGGAISGRVVDSATGAGVAAEFVLSRIDAPMDEISGSTDDTGAYGSNGLAAGEYAISAISRDGRSGASARIRLDAAQILESIEVSLASRETCGRVRIVLEGAIAPGRVTLWKAGVCRAFAFVDKGAVIELAMPEGACELRLYVGETQIERRDVDVTRGTVSNVRIHR